MARTSMSVDFDDEVENDERPTEDPSRDVKHDGMAWRERQPGPSATAVGQKIVQQNQVNAVPER